MSKQERIAELLELMKVPEVAKVMFLALDEAKGKLKSEIDRYRKSEGLFKKVRETIQKHSYRFELKKGEDDEWHIMNISPPPQNNIDIEAIIHTDIFPHIRLNAMFSGEVDIIDEFISKNKHNYNVQFIKFTDSHIFGIISEIVANRNGECQKEIEYDEVDWKNEKATMEERYREIFYYMEKEPNIREFIFDYFFMLLRPDSEKKLTDSLFVDTK